MSYKKFFSIIPSIFLLASCSLFSTSNEFKVFKYDVPLKVVKTDDSINSFVQKKDFETIEYYKNVETEEKRQIKSIRDLSYTYSNKEPIVSIDSIGERKLLVVPVYFSDSDSSLNKKYHTYIQNAFFGEKDKNIYYSVAEYYMRSSYGSLSLKGEVTDWFYYNHKIRDLIETGTHYTYISRKILNEVVSWLKTESNIDLASYDSDSDGYLDGIFMVYNYPYDNENTQSLLWAYTDYPKVEINESLKLSHYCWASVDFMNPNGNRVQANTYIHEVGHLFGLLDYYNTKENGYYQPTGSMDMMDYNLGDHTAFSKMLLNWVTPYVPRYASKIVLPSFLNSGKFILLPKKTWNGTPFDEYLLLEYHTPTGLNNCYNTKYAYTDRDGNSGIFHYFSSYGIKLYHVDARLAYYDDKGNEKENVICHLDDPNAKDILKQHPNMNYYHVSFLNTNSVVELGDFPLYALLGKNGSEKLKQNMPANDSYLFSDGDSFGKKDDMYFDFTFNTGETLTFAFEVDKIDSNGATISVSTR